MGLFKEPCSPCSFLTKPLIAQFRTNKKVTGGTSINAWGAPTGTLLKCFHQDHFIKFSAALTDAEEADSCIVVIIQNIAISNLNIFII